MAVVEVERSNGIMVVRMNRPERMNALNQEVREAMAEDGVISQNEAVTGEAPACNPKSRHMPGSLAEVRTGRSPRTGRSLSGRPSDKQNSPPSNNSEKSSTGITGRPGGRSDTRAARAPKTERGS